MFCFLRLFFEERRLNLLVFSQLTNVPTELYALYDRKPISFHPMLQVWIKRGASVKNTEREGWHVQQGCLQSSRCRRGVRGITQGLGYVDTRSGQTTSFTVSSVPGFTDKACRSRPSRCPLFANDGTLEHFLLQQTHLR